MAKNRVHRVNFTRKLENCLDFKENLKGTLWKKIKRRVGIAVGIPRRTQKAITALTNKISECADTTNAYKKTSAVPLGNTTPVRI